MNDTKILPDDPKLTAFALGELDGAEHAAMREAVDRDPALHAAVEEIRALAAQLEQSFATEPAIESRAMTTGAIPAKIHHPAKATLLKFPQLYYVVGGLAAACFAVVLAWYQPEVDARVTARREERLSQEKKLAAELREQRVARQSMVQLPASEGDEEEIKLSPFTVDAPTTYGYAATDTLAGARIRTELKDVAGSISVVTQEFLQDTGVTSADSLLRYAPSAEMGGLHGNFPSSKPAEFNTESYTYRAESDFLSAVQNPLSTFSADVDTASYANIRRFLQAGQRPPGDAVRIEEMLNYFPYRYAPPAADAHAPFAASMEVADAPWSPGHRLVRIGLKGREVASTERGAANLVFLLDVSGSMESPNKLPLVKASLRLLLERLRPDDRVAIVTYAGASGLALPSTPVARAREIVAALDELRPEGSTNGAMGIQLAYDIAKANFVSGGLNRVILCTDGDFNVGATSEGELNRLITEKAKSGVFLTVLGFGMGNYKDSTLQQLSDAGNGNYGYIDTRREAEKMLVEQVSGTLVTIAKDVKLQVEFNPAKVASYRLIGYEKRLLKKEDFNNDTVDAGEIGAGHTVTALYEIVPSGRESQAGDGGPAVDDLKYASSPVPAAKTMPARDDISDELLTLKIRFKEPAGDQSRKLEFPLVDRGARFADASDDFKFAASVAGFGMILRDSPHRGSMTLAQVSQWAEQGARNDTGGYRAEFIGLLGRAQAVLQ